MHESVKLKIEDKDNKLLITEAELTVSETLFIIHKLIQGLGEHMKVPAEVVYQDIGTAYEDDSWAQK